jgi:hypothetical protein
MEKDKGPVKRVQGAEVYPAATGIPKRGGRRVGGPLGAFKEGERARRRAEGSVSGGGEDGARTADRGLVPVTARTREKFLKKVLNIGGTGGTVEQNCCNRWYIRVWSVPLSVPLTKLVLS